MLISTGGEMVGEVWVMWSMDTSQARSISLEAHHPMWCGIFFDLLVSTFSRLHRTKVECRSDPMLWLACLSKLSERKRHDGVSVQYLSKDNGRG